jgi:hypothetical protein
MVLKVATVICALFVLVQLLTGQAAVRGTHRAGVSRQEQPRLYWMFIGWQCLLILFMGVVAWHLLLHAENRPPIWLLWAPWALVALCLGYTLTKGPTKEPLAGTLAQKWVGLVAAIAGLLMLGYFVITVIAFVTWGMPRERNGQYFLRTTDGQFIGPMTKGEYQQYEAPGVLMFMSGGVFFCFAGISLVLQARAARRLEDA